MFTHQYGITAEAIAIQGFQALDHSGPNSIAADMTDQLRELGALLTKHWFIAVLKQQPVLPVPTVEILSISGQSPSHHRGDRRCAGAHE